MQFRGLLFDLDGTLVNSLDFVEQSWRTWANNHGLDAQAVCDYLHGKPAVSTLRHFMPDASDAAVHDEFLMLEAYEARHAVGMTPVTGAVDFLNQLNAQAVPWGIVTSGSLKVASARIRHAGLPFPTALVTSEDIRHGKPHPEPFLLGAQKLKLPASDCIAFEDSYAGLVSARDAGCAVIDVLTAQSVAHNIDTRATLSHYRGLAIVAGRGADFFLKI
ncbi:HAD-IA family hydrolase [Atlantibacter sp.]|uniref:HAD-IA family hydrolase n=1 Tax=Atlantibacter sp. TaxID=1903473 RepID=UPI0028A74B24|nr:HAD-IA family hydrolase [Atlantibacter sp.]